MSTKKLNGTLQQEVSEELKAYLDEHKLSVTGLCNLLDESDVPMTVPTLYSIRNGTGNPGVVKIDMIGNWIKRNP